MKMPELVRNSSYRTMITNFGGLNDTNYAKENEFADMKNLSSDEFPIISQRGKRYKKANNVIFNGMIAKDQMYLFSGNYVYDENIKELKGISLQNSKKTLCSFGNRIVVLPDKRSIDTKEPDHTIVLQKTYSYEVNIFLCDESEVVYLTFIEGAESPSVITTGDYKDTIEGYPYYRVLWIDTSESIQFPKFKVCKKSNDKYVWSDTEVYFFITFTEAYKDSGNSYYVGFKNRTNAFRKNEKITFSMGSNKKAYPESDSISFDILYSYYDNENESSISFPIYSPSTSFNHITVKAPSDYNLFPRSYTQGYGQFSFGVFYKDQIKGFRITKSDIDYIGYKMPNIDFMTESNNRLWACRYGTNIKGDFVNEIYASYLGDEKLWTIFEGTSMDSYAASIGSDGDFTGCVTYNNHPIFFKENCMHIVYGSVPSNFQIQTISCRGVKKGCENSIAIVNGILYYRSSDNTFMAFDGSMPVCISESINRTYGAGWENCCAGAFENKYYASMEKNGKAVILVYDTETKMWHKEDEHKIDSFCSSGNNFYMMPNGKTDLWMNWNATGKLGVVDGDIPWFFETPDIGLDSPDNKYISRMDIRMQIPFGSYVYFYISYDSSDQWDQVASMTGNGTRSFTIPIRIRRCDHFRIRAAGAGKCKIYSISKTITEV